MPCGERGGVRHGGADGIGGMCDLRARSIFSAPTILNFKRNTIRITQKQHKSILFVRLNETPTKQTNNMQNEEGQNVDLYIPRKCSYTNRLITSMDKGSIQINVGHVDPTTGLYTGESTPFAISGYIRSKGESDMALNELSAKLMKN